MERISTEIAHFDRYGAFEVVAPGLVEIVGSEQPGFSPAVTDGLKPVGSEDSSLYTCGCS